MHIPLVGWVSDRGCSIYRPQSIKWEFLVGTCSYLKKKCDKNTTTAYHDNHSPLVHQTMPCATKTYYTMRSKNSTPTNNNNNKYHDSP